MIQKAQSAKTKVTAL